MSSETPTATAPRPAAPARDSHPVSTFEGVRLVAAREISATLRTKSFIWSFVILVVIVAALILGQRLLGDLFTGALGLDKQLTVATTQDPDALKSAHLEGVKVASAQEGLDLLRDGEVDAVWLTPDEAAGAQVFDADGNPLSTTSTSLGVVVGKDSYPMQVVDALSFAPVGAQLEYSGGVNPGLAYGLTIGFGVLFFMSVLSFSMRIAQTVVEEKASRIVELLLASLPPRTILAGKIIGGTVLATGQTLVLLAVALVCFAVAGNNIPLDQIGLAAVWFFVLFFFGFVFFAALYGGMAATVSRPEEVPDATTLLNMVAMAPYMLTIFFATNPEVMRVLSYIPISAPVAMPVRIFRGEAQWWEPLLALVILIASALVAILVGARLYERSVLHTQGKMKLAEAWRG